MSVRMGIRAILLVAAVAATTVIGAATPSQAAPTRAEGVGVAAGDCPFTNTVCLFDQTGYNGARFTASSLVPGGTCISLVDHGWGGRARSALNTNSTSAALFVNDDCIGGPFQLAGNSGVPDFGSFRPNSLWVP
jgi:hypothetical protein